MHHTIDKSLLKELLNSVGELLKLDDDYPVEGNVQSVNNLFAELDGPEALTEIINNCQNQNLQEHATLILGKYQNRGEPIAIDENFNQF